MQASIAFYVSIRRKRNEEAKKTQKTNNTVMVGLPLTPSSQSLTQQAFIEHLLSR